MTIKIIEHEGHKIEFECTIMNSYVDEFEECKTCRLEALNFPLRDYMKDCYLCPHCLDKVIIKGKIIE